MTNKERRYKIEKIEDFYHELTLEKTENIANICLLGGGALLLVTGILGGMEIMDVVDSISVYVGAGMSIPGIMRYAKSISKQTILEGKIGDLQEELKANQPEIRVVDFPNIETEESKGKKR